MPGGFRRLFPIAQTAVAGRPIFEQEMGMMRVYAMITGVMGIVGALLVIALTVQVGEPVIFASVLRSLAVLLAALGLYSAWALPGGKM